MGLNQNQNRMANCVDPNETAHKEPSHQELYCRNKKNSVLVFWSTGLKGLQCKLLLDIFCMFLLVVKC